MLKIAIVDDEPVVRKQLCSFLKEYESLHHVMFHVTVFENATSLLKQYQTEYDIIFLDIQMEGINGMEAARQIRQFDQRVILIFVTNMENYAINGYKVNALSYIVKPIAYIDFTSRLDSAIKKVESLRCSYILVKSKKEVIRLDLSKILYAESAKHQVIIYSENETITIYSSFKNLEQQLKHYHFARCSNCYLVNLRCVTSIQGGQVLIGDIALSISRSTKADFLNALTNYIGGDAYGH